MYCAILGEEQVLVTGCTVIRPWGCLQASPTVHRLPPCWFSLCTENILEREHYCRREMSNHQQTHHPTITFNASSFLSYITTITYFHDIQYFFLPRQHDSAKYSQGPEILQCCCLLKVFKQETHFVSD